MTSDTDYLYNSVTKGDKWHENKTISNFGSNPLPDGRRDLRIDGIGSGSPQDQRRSGMTMTRSYVCGLVEVESSELKIKGALRRSNVNLWILNIKDKTLIFCALT
jgi:hypothetical protein